MSEHRQRALGIGVLAAVRLAAQRASLPDVTADPFDHANRSLAAIPLARTRGYQMLAKHEADLRSFRRRSAPAMVRVAIEGTAESSVDDPDATLAEILATAITDCRAWLGLEERETAALAPTG